MKKVFFFLALFPAVLSAQDLWLETGVQGQWMTSRISTLYPVSLGALVGLRGENWAWDHLEVGISGVFLQYIGKSSGQASVQVVKAQGRISQVFELGSPQSLLGPYFDLGYGLCIIGDPYPSAGGQISGGLGGQYRWRISPELDLGAELGASFITENADFYLSPTLTIRLGFQIWKDTPSPVIPFVPPPAPLSEVPDLKLVDLGITEGRKIIIFSCFEENSLNLTPRFHEQIPPLVEYLERLEDLQSIEVLGYISDDGTGSDRSDLSRRRAEIVKGILSKSLKAMNFTWTSQGRGVLDPIAENSTPEGRLQNRRVELVLHQKKKESP